MIEVQLLGRFSVRRDGKEIPPAAFRQRLVRKLIRILVTRRGAFVSRDTLVDALWPDRPPADPAMNLKVLVNRARHALGDPSLIVGEAGGYRFRADGGCSVDTDTFVARVESGRSHLSARRGAMALRDLRTALDAWIGEPLAEDAYDDWAQEYRDSLDRAHLDALEGAARAALSLRDPDQAVSLAERAVAREPLREAAHMLLVESLAASGDAAGALAAFDAFRVRLADELGLDPSPRAFELQAGILRGEQPKGATRRRARGLWSPVPSDLPFVGRVDELDLLLDQVSLPASGSVVVAGPPGIGKSRLLAEVAGRASVAVLGVRAFLPDAEETWSLGRSLLREVLDFDPDAAEALPGPAAQALAGILPELGDLRRIGHDPLDPESLRALALEGAARLVEAAAAGRAALLVDDLQWSDATSLSLLLQIAKRKAGPPLLLAHRTEEPAPGGPLVAFLEGLRNVTEVRSLSLGTFSPDVVAQLVGDGALASVIATETDATPLAVAEVIRDLSRQGALERGPEGIWRARGPEAYDLAREVARAGQRRTFQRRAARQPEGRRLTLALLSLLRREAPARLIAVARGADEAAILGELDALARAGLVRLGHAGWSTAHDLVADAIAEGTEAPERAGLHSMLARALGETNADPAELARHLEATGDTQAAAEAFARGAHMRLSEHASDEAVLLADAALSLMPTSSVAASLLEVRAEAQTHRGRLAAARDDLRKVLELRPSGPERVPTLSRLAMLTSGSRDYVRAGDLVDLALAESGGDAAARAEALTVGAIIDINTDRWDRALARSREALTHYTAAEDIRGMARIMDAQALHAFFSGNLREAAPLFDRVARLFRDSGQLLRIREPRIYRGLALAWMARPGEGLVDVDEVLEVERSLGRPEGEAFCLWGRAEVLVRLGRLDEARRDAQEGIAIARSIGHREWTAAALTVRGLACDLAGDLSAAEAAHREALELSEHMPILLSGVSARLSSVLTRRGAFVEAEAFIEQALREGPPLYHLEAELSRAELALARGDPDAEAIRVRALALAEGCEYVGSPIYHRLRGWSP